jgi:hypothetical protein
MTLPLLEKDSLVRRSSSRRLSVGIDVVMGMKMSSARESGESERHEGGCFGESARG